MAKYRISGVRTRRRPPRRYGAPPFDIEAASAQQRQRTAHQESLRRAAGAGRLLSPEEAELHKAAQPYISAHKAALKAGQTEALPKIREQAVTAGYGELPYFRAQKIQEEAGGVAPQRLTFEQRLGKQRESQLELERLRREGKRVEARAKVAPLVENSPAWDIATPDPDDPVSARTGQMLATHPTAPGILRKMKALQEEMDKPGAPKEDIYPQFAALERRYLTIADRLYGRAFTRVGQEQTAEQRRLTAEAKLQGRQQVQADIKTIQGMIDSLQDTDEAGKTISTDPERTGRLTALRKELEDRFEAMLLPEAQQPTPTPEASPVGEAQPKVTTKNEWDKLPPRATFEDKDGNIRRKP